LAARLLAQSFDRLCFSLPYAITSFRRSDIFHLKYLMPYWAAPVMVLDCTVTAAAPPPDRQQSAFHRGAVIHRDGNSSQYVSLEDAGRAKSR